MNYTAFIKHLQSTLNIHRQRLYVILTERHDLRYL